MKKERIYCGLDVGSQRLKVAFLKSVESHGHVDILGVYDHPSYGYKDGSVTDLNELSECVHNSIEELSKKTQFRVKDLQLGIGGQLVDSRESNTIIPLVERGNKIIASKDVKRVNYQARLLGLKMEEEILHHLPQHYLIDDVNTALNPLGLYGRKLGVFSRLIIAKENVVRNVVKAVQHSGYDVNRVLFSTYAASDVVLTAEEKKDGCAIIDIGAAVTSVMIFKEGLLKTLDKIYIGGDQFSSAIATSLNIPFDLAEEIKKSYGGVLSDNHRQEEILVKKDQSYIPIKREAIYLAIEPLIVRLVESICASLKASGMYHFLNKGLVVVGGGALLAGLIEKIEEVSNLSVRLGKLNIPSSRGLSNTALYSAVVGLAYTDLVDRTALALSNQGKGGWAQNVRNKVVELYQEYF
jgi:cell division protein FtsA